jgi:hypothetical protein
MFVFGEGEGGVQIIFRVWSRGSVADQIKGLYKLFDACDCTMVEVSQGGVGFGGGGG